MPSREERPEKPAPNPVGERVKLTVYLNADEFAAVKALARKEDRSLASTLRQIIRKHFKIED